MTTHQGNLVIERGDTRDHFNLASITGYLDVREGATLNAPLLASVGGYLYVLTAPLFFSIVFFVGLFRCAENTSGK